MPSFGFGFQFGLVKKKPGIAYDAMAAAYFAAVPNAFSAARKTIINTLIAGLRADGNLTKLDRLWLLANTTTGNAVIDIIGLNAATLVNAPAFVADQGYTGDGATSYVNTNYNPATNGVNYILDDCSFGAYSRTNAANNFIGMGMIDSGVSGAYFYHRYSDDNGYCSINNDTYIVPAALDSLGLRSLTRTASNLSTAYNRGISAATSAAASVSVASLNFYVCARSLNGVANLFDVRQYSIAFMGAGSINQSTLYTRIQQYMTDLGTQV